MNWKPAGQSRNDRWWITIAKILIAQFNGQCMNILASRQPGPRELDNLNLQFSAAVPKLRAVMQGCNARGLRGAEPPPLLMPNWQFTTFWSTDLRTINNMHVICEIELKLLKIFD